MTISAHDITAWVGTQQLDIIDASVAMDETWSPYVQASLTTVLNESLQDALDPRTGGRVHVYISQSYGQSDHLSSLTATYGGGTIADITTVWGGQQITDLSAWYFIPYNASESNQLSTLSSTYGGGTIADLTADWDGLTVEAISEKYWRSYPSGIYDNYRRGFDLAVRTRNTDMVQGIVQLELASDEALLQDYALVSVNNFAPASLQLRNVIMEVLALIGGYLVPDTTDATVAADAAIWAPGQTAWDYLEPMVQTAGFRLYCDERRRFYLVDDTFTQPGLAELFALGTIKAVDDIISLDDDYWFDAVVVKYTWVDELGATLEAYDTASVTGFKKVKLLEFQSNYPGPGAAQRILDRALSQGILRNITAVSNYAVQPSMAADIYLQDEPTEHLYIQAVTWNIPGDEMTIKTRQPVTT